ncbi:complexin-2-like [Scleropages formosus]|uniref:Complexin-1 n=1 Tax=Scleropages formosus TaxID=113540 RepID=A0A0P7V5K2_SCLFO|nr:complexin-2-like [Scleropages formosus]
MKTLLLKGAFRRGQQRNFYHEHVLYKSTPGIFMAPGACILSLRKAVEADLQARAGGSGGQLKGATKDMGKMLGGEEEKDPDAQKKEEERQEALRQQEEERKAKYARMEAERESIRQGIRDKKEEREAEAQAAMEQASEGSLTRPKKAVPAGCGNDEEEEEGIMDTVMKYLPGPLQDMFNKK